MAEVPAHGAGHVRRGRPRRAALAAVLVAAFVAAALAACGGQSATDDPLVGFWLGGGGSDQMTMIQVGKDGDDYIVLANPDAPAGAAEKDGDSLVIDGHAVDIELTPAGPDQLAVTFSGEMLAAPQTTTLKRVTQTEYADASVAQGIAVLRRGLAMWKAGGGKQYPPAEEVAADGQLGRMVRWPTNPFTGGPMQQGTAPGAFTYELVEQGKDYSLIGHLSDGETVGE